MAVAFWVHLVPKRYVRARVQAVSAQLVHAPMDSPQSSEKIWPQRHIGSECGCGCLEQHCAFIMYARTWVHLHTWEKYQNKDLTSHHCLLKSSIGAMYARLGFICQHLIDIHAKHASVAILVTNLLIARLICGHIAWTLVVQDLHAKTGRYFDPDGLHTYIHAMDTCSRAWGHQATL
jgi:hypothetical protein